MKKGKAVIALVSAVLLAVIVWMAVHSDAPQQDNMPAWIRLSDGQTVSLWTGDGETYIAFLPGHAEPEEMQLLPAGELEVRVDGQTLPLSCSALQPEREYGISWQQDGTVYQKSLRLLRSGDVATLYVQTQSGTMDYIHEKKGNAEGGSLRLYDKDGSLNFSGSLRSIRGRGNSTWDVPEKKPYSLELTQEADLLGMGAAKKWILLSDALDASALRNRIAYDFASEAGLAFTPEVRWTEVYLNGTYAGLYLLSERVEVDPQRVDLGPDGSLIYKDRDTRLEEKADPYFFTDSGQCIQVRESHDIASLKRQLQAMEDALLAPVGDAWQAHIDLDSWVKKYLMEEVMGLYDAGFQSQYYYSAETGAGSKIYAGPIWDYDSSLGNPTVWALNSPRGLYAWRPEAMVGYETPWQHCLYEKELFRRTLKQEYESVFLPLLQQLPEKIMEEYALQIALSYERNRIRWNVETEGLAAEAASIAEYIQQRTAFLNQLWLEQGEFCILRLQEGEKDGFYGYYAVEPGSLFDALPEKEGEGFLGWYRLDTDQPFDPEEPITEALQLYPRYEGTSREEEEEDGLMDLLLAVYHYVPALVLVLVGTVMVPLGFRKSRASRSGEKQPTI